MLFAGIASAQTITVAASDTTICIGTPVTFTAVWSSSTPPHFKWKINSTVVGADSFKLTTSAFTNGDTVRCMLVNSAFDTIYAASNNLVMIVDMVVPSAGTLSGLGEVCEGDSITLSATATGGDWYTTNPHASVSNGVVTGITAWYFECAHEVDDTVLYIVKNSCGSDTAKHTITVIPLPNPYYDLVFHYRCPFMFGLIDLPLREPTCFTSYYFTPTDSGIDYKTGELFFIDANSCGSDTVKHYREFTYYTFAPMPELILSQKRICVNDTAHLQTPNTSFGQIWKLNSGNGVLIDDGSKAYVVGKSEGIVPISLRYSNICGVSPWVAYDTITVASSPATLMPPTTLCKESIVLLADTPLSNGTWSSSNSQIADVSSGKIVAKDTGTASISYVLPNGCYLSTQISVLQCPKAVKVFPQPAHNELIVRLTITGYYASFVIYDVLGQEILRRGIADEYTVVDISNLADGMYFIRFVGKNHEEKIRFSKG
jgi:hypothetical protein